MNRRRIAAVIVVAPALGMAVPVVPSVIAQEAEACTTWTVGMVEDEGGEVLAAQACSIDQPDAWLVLNCFWGSVFVRYDLGMGAESLPPLGEVTDVTFSTGSDAVTLSMSYQEMDGMHVADAGVDDPLVHLLKAGDTVTISDVPGRYLVKSFSLEGSAAAIGKLVADCD